MMMRRRRRRFFGVLRRTGVKDARLQKLVARVGSDSLAVAIAIGSGLRGRRET